MVTQAEIYRPVAEAAEPVWKAMLDCVGEHFWPMGQCIATSGLLLSLLRAAGADANLRMGDYVGDGMRAAHVWIMFSDGSVIDPTYGQFHAGEKPLGVFTDESLYEGETLVPELEAEVIAESRVRGSGACVSLSSGGNISRWRTRQESCGRIMASTMEGDS